MGIFDKRVEYKPFEYGHITNEMIYAMWSSHWTHREFNFKSDVQDFKTKINDDEREVIKRAVLLISQIEVAVKSYWGNIGSLLPKPEIADMGAVFGGVECYDDNTEILTSNGYVKFEHLKLTDKVAAYNKDTGSVSFEEPERFIRKHYEGNLHYYKSDDIDIMVTPKHNMVAIDKNTETVDFLQSESKLLKDNYLCPVSAKAVGTKTTLTPFDNLVIVLQTHNAVIDGTEVTLRTHEPTMLEYLLKELKIEHTNKDGIYNFDIDGIVRKEDISRIQNFDIVDLSYIDHSWAENFIEKLLFWTNRNAPIFSDKNKNTVDKVSAIATLGGYSTKVKKRNEIKPSYSLFLEKTDSVEYPTRKEVPYNGDVYCVTVSTGAIIVRRNGITSVCGNCIHSMAYSEILTKLGLENEFKKMLKTEEAVINRIKYLSKYNDKLYKDDRQNILYSLILFTLFTEATSLFSQFYTILGFNRFNNVFKDIANVIQYTAQEENCHMEGGIALINTIVEEYPELMDQKMIDKIYEESKEAYLAESKLIEWILQGFENEFLSQDILEKYVKYRLNECLTRIGINKPFKLKEEDISKFLWMEEQIQAPTITDFFAKKPIDYAKKDKPFDPDELF